MSVWMCVWCVCVCVIRMVLSECATWTENSKTGDEMKHLLNNMNGAHKTCQWKLKAQRKEEKKYPSGMHTLAHTDPYGLTLVNNFSFLFTVCSVCSYTLLHITPYRQSILSFIYATRLPPATGWPVLPLSMLSSHCQREPLCLRCVTLIPFQPYFVHRLLSLSLFLSHPLLVLLVVVLPSRASTVKYNWLTMCRFPFHHCLIMLLPDTLICMHVVWVCV